MKYLLREGF